MASEPEKVQHDHANYWSSITQKLYGAAPPPPPSASEGSTAVTAEDALADAAKHSVVLLVDPAAQRGVRSDEEYKAQLTMLEEMNGSSLSWSGTGNRYDVNYESLAPEIRLQLMSTNMLGTGTFGHFHRVVLHQVPIAKKSIRTSSRAHLEAMKSEVEAARLLDGHRHIVKLVGTYITSAHGEDMLHILTFPVADCDLDIFLSNYDDINHLTAYGHWPVDPGGRRKIATKGDNMLAVAGLTWPRYPITVKDKCRFLALKTVKESHPGLE